MTTDKQEAVQIAVELYQTWQANASRHGGNIHLLMQRVWDAWQPAAAADKPRHDGEWVSVPRTYLRLVHDTLQDIDAYIIVPTFARDDWETAKEQTAVLAASPATSALGTPLKHTDCYCCEAAQKIIEDIGNQVCDLDEEICSLEGEIAQLRVQLAAAQAALKACAKIAEAHKGQAARDRAKKRTPYGGWDEAVFAEERGEDIAADIIAAAIRAQADALASENERLKAKLTGVAPIVERIESTLRELRASYRGK